MPHRPFLTLAALAAASIPACRSAEPAGRIEHVVLVWLKQPGDASARQRLVDASRELAARIPEILSLEVGEPLPSNRPMVDDSFDVMVSMRFRDATSLAVYEQHPVHLQAVEEVLLPLTARFVVHDAVLR